MPRLSNRGPSTISLFPFLSLLASVIATLTLIIACQALGQIDESRGPPPRPGGAAPPDEALPQRLQRIVPADVFDPQNLGPTEEWLAAQLVIRERERKELLRRLKAKEDATAEAPPVRIEPMGSGEDLRPTFVEVRAEGLVLYPKKQEVRSLDVPTSPAFARLLETCPQRVGERGIVIFLLRPTGVRVYHEATVVVQQKKARYGLVPVPEAGKLDLSGFPDQ